MVLGVWIVGLILGSFLAAYTWRLPRGIPISKGRSFCPNCRKKIQWYDNIPVLSFFLLGRKCRACNKPVSPRYFLIEVSLSLLFALMIVFLDKILINIPWLSSLSFVVSLPYLLFLGFIFIGILIVDLEEMLIPDELTYLGILGTVIILLASNGPVYLNLFTGFLFGLVFLLLNLLTRGRGMGLGDGKLALLIGIIVGPSVGVVALMTTFIAGSVVGIILILLKKAKLQQKIAFGPFLVIGFLGSIFFANEIIRFF